MDVRTCSNPNSCSDHHPSLHPKALPSPTMTTRATRLNAIAYISAQNHPILVRTFTGQPDELKYHYVAHTSLDVIEERGWPTADGTQAIS